MPTKPRQRDQRSAEAQAYRSWYWTSRWRRIAKAQLQAEPLCRMCMERGLIVAASVADHVEKHEGNPDKFWDTTNLQSLCARCHSSDKQRTEKGGKPKPTIGLDGWPMH